jgi:excisionase family DNA binding protein
MNQKTQDPAKIERLAYTVKQAKDAIGLSRSKLYQMMKEGTLHSLKVAGRRLIPAEDLHALLRQ